MVLHSCWTLRIMGARRTPLGLDRALHASRQRTDQEGARLISVSRLGLWRSHSALGRRAAHLADEAGHGAAAAVLHVPRLGEGEPARSRLCKLARIRHRRLLHSGESCRHPFSFACERALIITAALCWRRRIGGFIWASSSRRTPTCRRSTCTLRARARG